VIEDWSTRAPRLLHVLREFLRSHSTVARVFLWLVALSLVILGLYWVVLAPILGDDLVFVTFGGLGTLWSDQGLAGLLSLWWDASVGSNHVTPLNGLVYVGQIVVISGLSHLGIPIAWAWGALRLFWIMLALVSASWMLEHWFHYMTNRSNPQKLPLLVFFSGISAVFIAIIQLRALWANDSVLSYSVAAWLTAALAFIFVGLIPKFFDTKSPSQCKPITLAAVIAITGILIYELMVVAIAAGAFALIAIWFIERKEFGWRQLVYPMVLAIFLPAVIFLLTQYARTFWPSWYSGTQTGYADWVIPVTLYAVLNTFPLTNLPKAFAVSEQVYLDFLFVGSVVFAVVGLFWLFVWQLGQLQVVQTVRLGKQFTIRTLIFMLVLLVLWGGSGLVFAVSAKYQVELGTELGTTYLHYSFGLLSLTVFVVATLLFTWTSARWLSVALIAITLSIGIAQALTNSIVTSELNAEKSWTRDLANSQAAGYSLDARCELDRQLEESGLPQIQIAAIRAGLYRTSIDLNKVSRNCAKFRGQVSRPENLTLN